MSDGTDQAPAEPAAAGDTGGSGGQGDGGAPAGTPSTDPAGTGSSDDAAEKAEKADRAKPDKADKSDKDDDSNALDAAKNQATDQDEHDEAMARSRARYDAVGSLFGSQIGYANIFMQEGRIGSAVAGNQYGAGNAAAAYLSSGPVAAETIAGIAATFVEPSGYEKALRLLHDRSVLFLQAPAGSGRTAAALRLLTEQGDVQVHKLDPGTSLRKPLPASAMEAGNGYLLESMEVAQAGALRAAHVERIQHQLRKSGCKLVIVVEPSTPLRLDELDDFVADGGRVDDVDELVLRHFTQATRPGTSTDILRSDEVLALLADMVATRAPLREIARFAVQVAEVQRGRAELADVLARFSAARHSMFRAWFDEQSDIDQRAFVISLAVFNGMPLHLVSDAAHLLAALFRMAESPSKKDRARRLFDTARSSRIERAAAETVTSTEYTRYGWVDTQVVRFKDDGLPRRILEHVCREYNDAHDLVIEWLKELARFDDIGMRARVGAAFGLLSRFEVEQLRVRVFLPWALSGNLRDREAAIGALHATSLQPELAPLVTRLLTDWCRPWQPIRARQAGKLTAKAYRNRQATAAEAIGTIGVAMPDWAEERLSNAAFEATWVVARAVTISIVELLMRPELTGRMLALLLRWTDRQRLARRFTGHLAALHLCSVTTVDVPEGQEPWPGVVWLANTDDRHRTPLVTLIARLLDAPDFLQWGWDVLSRWVRLAERDPAFREPLGGLLVDLARATGDELSLRRHLELWAAQRKGPAAAVADLIDMLNRKDEEQ